MSETPDESQPLPSEEGPATLPGVKGRAKVTDDDDDDDIALIVAAVNAIIRNWPIVDQARGLEEWPADIVLGANMLGARLWRRKDTPGGVQIFGADAIAYVQRNDPDVAMLLQLGDWSRPAVG